jgi:hypothetical protein
MNLKEKTPLEKTKWTTSAITFNIALTEIIVPNLHEKKNITFHCHIATNLDDKDIINGNNILLQ